jgi:hypothetical protein
LAFALFLPLHRRTDVKPVDPAGKPHPNGHPPRRAALFGDFARETNELILRKYSHGAATRASSETPSRRTDSAFLCGLVEVHRDPAREACLSGAALASVAAHSATIRESKLISPSTSNFACG